jgi:tRNA A37 N6-isopentenylltransferase MiaA
MALTNSDKKEIESMVRKEIKDFLNSNTTKQFEEKLIDQIRKEIKKGKLETEVKDIIVKSFREFFTLMYQQRSFWESKFKNA